MVLPAPVDGTTVRDSFLATLICAELLTRAQLTRAEAAIPTTVASPIEAAVALVKAGLLTHFQVDKLLSGQTDGLHLGAYILLEQLGSSRSGCMYRAKHRTMNRLVAIEILSPEWTRDSYVQDAFYIQARAAAQLNHPNIVTTYDANEDAGRLYLVIELVEGPTLDAFVDSNGPLTVAEVCELSRQIAAGLDHAHSKGVVHGELTADRLIVTCPTKSVPDMLLKIAGFGLPRQVVNSNSTLCHVHQHSVSLEQGYCSDARDPRVDLQSLGVVMYQLLAGKSLSHFCPQTLHLHREVFDRPPPIQRLRPDVPLPLATLIHQLLLWHPKASPSTAREVLERLDGFSAASTAVNFDLNHAPYESQSAIPQQHTVREEKADIATGMIELESPWKDITIFRHENTKKNPVCLTKNYTARQFQVGAHQSHRAAVTWLIPALALVMVGVCLVGIQFVIRLMAQ
jgi:serine/threonine-protein kinase